MTRQRIRCPQCRQPGTRITTGNGTTFIEHWAHSRMDKTITALVRVCTLTPQEKGHPAC